MVCHNGEPFKVPFLEIEGSVSDCFGLIARRLWSPLSKVKIAKSGVLDLAIRPSKGLHITTHRHKR